LRLSKQGITRTVCDDELTWKWPWARQGQGKYYSAYYGMNFGSKKDYWKHIGAIESVILQRGGKIDPYGWTEVLSTWVRFTYPQDHIVVLTNINALDKSVAFWARIPKDRIQDLMQDVVVLRCKSKAEVFSLVDSTPQSFADAYGYSENQLIGTNQ
jgi:hypothetical protein